MGVLLWVNVVQYVSGYRGGGRKMTVLAKEQNIIEFCRLVISSQQKQFEKLEVYR